MHIFAPNGEYCLYNLALYIDNNDNKMTFFGNIVSFATLALRARGANDTTRAQINNIPEKSHVIPLLTLLFILINW